jgi:hypothetical protein
MEFIRHLFGLCGEAHPSAIYYLGLPTVVIGFRVVIKNFILGLRIRLKQFLSFRCLKKTQL